MVKRLKKLINRLNAIDDICAQYNPVLASVAGGECWEKVALIYDNEEILHQDLDSLERAIDDYDSRMAKSVSQARYK
jgi:uncharacterized protein (DUF779 family)